MRILIDTVNHGVIISENIDKTSKQLMQLVDDALTYESSLRFPKGETFVIIPYEVLSTSIITIQE